MNPIEKPKKARPTRWPVVSRSFGRVYRFLGLRSGQTLPTHATAPSPMSPKPIAAPIILPVDEV